jgi:hypothetical protein
MKIFVVALVVVLALALHNVALATPLDDYISAPDPTFSWKVNNTFRSTVLGYTAYNIELVSQTWMTSNETNQPVRSLRSPFVSIFSSPCGGFMCKYYFIFFWPIAYFNFFF